MNEIEFLDRIRGIAQLGLTYARDAYDIARYEELLKLAAEGYESVSGLDSGEAIERFRREVGYVTPKVGVDGAVFSEDGTGLLLIRRADSGRWALPGGWGELGENPETSVARELLEETTLTVEVGPLIAVNTQLPDGRSAHTSVHLLYRCTLLAGTPQPTAEATEVSYRDPDEISDWAGPHGAWAHQAMAWHHAGHSGRDDGPPGT